MEEEELPWTPSFLVPFYVSYTHALMRDPLYDLTFETDLTLIEVFRYPIKGYL